MSNLIQPPDATPALDPETHSDPPSSATPNIHQVSDGRAHWWQLLRAGLSWVPSIVVFAALVTIAWYGHQNQWKLPNLTAAAAATTQVDPAWCDSHGVPEEQCIVCKPDLVEEPLKLNFCQQHGVHGCVFCIPSLAETKQPTGPTPRDLQRAKRALTLRPRKENLAIGGASGARVQFASTDAMKKAGVEVELVERRQIVESIAAAGEIRYDATKTALVSPQADGIVRRVLVEVGAWVTRGQVLAVIDSTEAGHLKTELLAALADERLQKSTVSRLRPLAGQAVAGKRLLESENDLQQASSEVDHAAGALGNRGIHVDLARVRELGANEADAYVQSLGLSDLPSDALSLGTGNKNLVAVIAPLEGQVVERTATIGQVVARGSELFRLVDTRSVWLDLRVPAEDTSLIQLGQSVFYLPDGQLQKRQGNVTWISTDVDPQTRTVRVRAELKNADQNLRNESFGRGEIILRDEPDAIVVPESAVQWDGAGQIVLVRDARFFEQGRPKFFVARSVRMGIMDDGFVEIIAGILPGEVVATDGSDVLKAQLLRGNLGAGCTCGH